MGAALEEFLKNIHLPDAFVAYAAANCREFNLGNSNRSKNCSSGHKMQILMIILYGTSICSTYMAAVCHVLLYTRWSGKGGWLGSSRCWSAIALLASFLASIVVAVITGAADVFVSGNLPSAMIQVNIGRKLLSFTWAAVASHLIALGLCGWARDSA